MADRQQQEQPGDSQHDPEKIDETAGTQYGNQQRAGKFKRDGHPQRQGQNGLIKQKIHAPQHHPVHQQRRQITGTPARTPRPEKQHQRTGAHNQTQ